MNQQQYWDKMAKHGVDAAVIDPEDTKGYKNKYIIQLRDNAILKALNQEKGAKIIDFGCGSGNLSEVLSQNAYDVSGIDISKKLLEFAQQRQDQIHWDVYHYNGEKLPFDDNSMDAIVTYVVLNHILDNKQLKNTLDEFARVLKPNGQVIAVEQISRNTHIDNNASKKQRRLDDFIQRFQQSGLQIASHNTIRRGHFPLLYLMRFGLIPPSLFRTISSVEAFFGSLTKQPIFDYADVVFSLRKP